MHKKRKKITVLLTGSGAPGWVPIYKCLVKNHPWITVLGCDIASQTAGAYYAAKHFTVPFGTDKLYIPKIISIAKKEKIDIIIPITDAELLPLAKNRDKFEEINTIIPVTNSKTLALVQDKLQLYNFLSAQKISVPEFYEVSSWEKFVMAVKKLGYPKKPICFKPPFTWGSRGFRIIDPNADMFELYLTQKPSQTIVPFSYVKEILQKQKPFPKLIVMEYLPGDEYSVDVLIHNNKIHYIVPRVRTKLQNGISIEGSIEKSHDITEFVKRVLSVVSINFAVGMQLRYDANHQLKLLEINPRLQGTTVLSYGAGVNLPYFLLIASLGEKIPQVKINYNTKMFRNYQEVFFRNNKKVGNT